MDTPLRGSMFDDNASAVPFSLPRNKWMLFQLVRLDLSWEVGRPEGGMLLQSCNNYQALIL
jgi:hypothetical protein